MMDRSAFFGAARSLLAAHTSANFRRLCELIEAWPDAQERDEILLPYVLGALKPWPVHLLLMPQRWLTRCLHDDPPPYLAMGQSLYLDESSPMAALELLHDCAMSGRWRGLYVNEVGVTGELLERLMRGSALEMIELDSCMPYQEAFSFIQAQARQAPLKELFLTRLGLNDACAQEIAQWPELQGLETLELSRDPITTDGVAALAQSSQLEALKCLYLRRIHGDPGVVEVIGSGRWTKLEQLDISRSRLGGAAWSSLARLDALMRLVIEGAALTPEDLTQLLETGLLARLRQISLEDNGLRSQDPKQWRLLEGARCDELYLGGNLFDDEDVAQLPWESLKRLTRLQWSEGGLSPRGVEQLVTRVPRDQLKTLVLWGNRADEDTIKAIWRSPWPQLEHLNLNRIEFGTSFGTLTAERGIAPQLSSLKIYRAGIRDDGLIQLSQWRGAPQLRELYLSDCSLTNRGLVELARSPLLDHVRKLTLVENKFGDGGLSAIAKSPHVKSLRELILWSTRFGVTSMRALAKSSLSAQLEVLDLCDGAVTSRGIEALAQGKFEALRFIDIQGSPLEMTSAAALGQAQWPALEHLMLTRCRLQGQVFNAWLEAGGAEHARLRRLGLGQNFFGDAGLISLLERANLPMLHELSLWDNSLTHTSMIRLGQWPGLANLHELNLNRNGISHEGLASLLESPHLGALRALKLCSARLNSASLECILGLGAQRLNTLNLNDNNFSASMLAQFLRDSRLRGLAKLWCGWQSWSRDALISLADSESMGSLEELYISNSSLSDSDVEILASGEALRLLRLLDLNSNAITDRGIAHLTRSSSLDRLEILRLSGNPLGDAGIDALARWPGLRSLTELTLPHAQASHAALKRLLDSPYLRPKLRLELSRVFPAEVTQPAN